MATRCQAYQTGDSTQCGACGLQWDTNDQEPPPCGLAGLSARAANLATLRKKFERWAVAHRHSVAKSGADYFDAHTRDLWRCYQDATAAAHAI